MLSQRTTELYALQYQTRHDDIDHQFSPVKTIKLSFPLLHKIGKVGTDETLTSDNSSLP